MSITSSYSYYICSLSSATLSCCPCGCPTTRTHSDCCSYLICCSCWCCCASSSSCSCSTRPPRAVAADVAVPPSWALPRAVDVPAPLPQAAAADITVPPPGVVAADAIPAPTPRAVVTAIAVPPPWDKHVVVAAAAAVHLLLNLSWVERNWYLFADVLRGESAKRLTLEVSGKVEKSISCASFSSWSCVS